MITNSHLRVHISSLHYQLELELLEEQALAKALINVGTAKEMGLHLAHKEVLIEKMMLVMLTYN